MKTRRTAFTFGSAFCSALLVFATSGWALPGDEHWDPQFGRPGIPSAIWAAATHHGRLYVGGSTIATGTNTSLSVWDGAQWTSMGVIKGSIGTAVFDLASVGDNLYVGGYFTNIDGVPIRSLARWDGIAWNSLGFTGVVFSLSVDGNNLYVGGQFTGVGGVDATNVAVWDGNAWHALGAGLGNTVFAPSPVRSVLATNGVVYAGGSFTNSGSLVISNVARWNGVAWTELDGGVNGAVQTLALQGADLHVGGSFTQAGSAPANKIAKWNGTTWSALGSGLNGTASSIAVLGDLLCVTGTFTTAGGMTSSNFAAWNGSTWIDAGSGLNVAGNRVIGNGTNVYVCGDYLYANGIYARAIASWDGTQWGVIGPPGRINGLDNTVRAIAGDGTNVYVGGSFTHVGQIQASRIARFDGKNWFPIGSGLNGDVTAIAIRGSNVFVGGSFTLAGGGYALHLARWDGSQWSEMGWPNSGTVSALAIRGDDLFVGGNFQFQATDGLASAIARWDGTNWWVANGPVFGIPISGVGVDALAIKGNDVYLGGQFVGKGNSGPLCANILRWDGSDFQSLTTGVNTNVNAIAVMGNDVYVGGLFTNAGGVTASRIAKWDGVNWSSLGTGLSGSSTFAVNALAAIGGNLYVGGSFTNAGGMTANRIAKWDGTNWFALGSGVSSTVNAVAVSGSDLYVGGTFQSSGGGKPSFFLGHWNDSRNFDLVPSISLKDPQMNISGPFRFSIMASNAGSYVIEATTGFSGWTPLQTNSAGFYEFSDLIPPNIPGGSIVFVRPRDPTAEQPVPWPGPLNLARSSCTLGA